MPPPGRWQGSEHQHAREGEGSRVSGVTSEQAEDGGACPVPGVVGQACWPSRTTNGPRPAATRDRKSSPPASETDAVVTGAASGIGLALTERFALAGLDVVLADVDQTALEAAEQEIASLGAKTLAVPTDVSDEAHKGPPLEQVRCCHPRMAPSARGRAP